MTSALVRQAIDYYEMTLRTFGPCARGVDWNSEHSQHLRFVQLMKLVEPNKPFRLIDFGCGYGALADFLFAQQLPVEYIGYDASQAMIDTASSLPRISRAYFTSDLGSLAAADYVVASGLFNVKLNTDDKVWTQYMRDTVATIAGLSQRGFAFNVLSDYSDVDKRRPSLHYSNPLEWFHHCKVYYSSRVALLHDYPLFEFTLLVRMQE